MILRFLCKYKFNFKVGYLYTNIMICYAKKSREKRKTGIYHMKESQQNFFEDGGKSE